MSPASSLQLGRGTAVDVPAGTVDSTIFTSIKVQYSTYILLLHTYKYCTTFALPKRTVLAVEGLSQLATNRGPISRAVPLRAL